MKQFTPKMNKLEKALQQLPGNEKKTLAQILKPYYDKYKSWELVAGVLSKELDWNVSKELLYRAAPRLFKQTIVTRK